MQETEFFKTIEYAICRLLAASDDPALRGMTCDGLIGERFIFEPPAPRGLPVPSVSGTAWMLGHDEDEWEFVLPLPPTVRSIEEIEWEAMLPAEGASGWLDVDLANRRLTFNTQRKQ